MTNTELVGLDRFTVIYAWMPKLLKLKSNDLLTFAVIHGFTQNSKHNLYNGSQRYLAETIGSTVNGLQNSLARLVEKELIHKGVEMKNGKANITYRSLVTYANEKVKIEKVDENSQTENEPKKVLPKKLVLPKNLVVTQKNMVVVTKKFGRCNINIWDNSIDRVILIDSQNIDCGAVFSKAKNTHSVSENTNQNSQGQKPHSAALRSKPTVEEKDCQGQQKQDPEDMENQTDIYDFLIDESIEEPNVVEMAKAVAEAISKRIEEKKVMKDDPFAEFMRKREKEFDEECIF